MVLVFGGGKEHIPEEKLAESFRKQKDPDPGGRGERML